MSSDLDLQPGVEPYPGYCLHLPLGRGASGEVWEARDRDGKPIAMKFVRCKNTASATKEVRSFQALSGLRHKNLLRVYQVFLQAGYVVIAMELADGSLMDVLDVCLTDYGSPIAPDLACQYLSDAAQALDFLNQRRHILDGRRVSFQHCDIKPSNLLVCGETVKVADYGLASALANAIEPHSRAGTLEFAAPEVYRGQLSDQTDQYALAVSYCLLRSGQLPFTDSPHRFTTTYNRGQPDLSMLSEAERPIIAKALSVATVNRWPTSSEMMAHLQSLFPVNVG